MIIMATTMTNHDIEEGKRISVLFSNLSEENKTMAMVYLSALRDKEIADGINRQQSDKTKELQDMLKEGR